MGKSNKANRTKGNTRPSSSEHSAQLLSLSGRSISGFIGFDSLEKDIPSYVPVTGQHTDAADLSVDSDLRMVMRKMLKRDSVTRLKALQEFGDLCAEKEKNIVKAVLPFWPRLFNKLALDYDRRIREATHQANGKLIANVKREIAPFLKNIMGVWLLGQNDLYAPAASAAQTTFTDTFPKSKQSEALMYCKNEIFSLFKDNLFEQTAKSMSDLSSTSAEDAESKYTLVISATLQAMKLFLTIISPSEISNVEDDFISIISENKFWKYSKNKESQIRASWYMLISFLCHVKPQMFAEMEKKLVSAVFGCLSENDPVVAPAVWDSALHVVINFENCWQEINIHKVVLPQLWSLLTEGGNGNAHVVYPCILPFLSKFPREVISKETVMLQFFTCLKNSLLLDSVKLSSMECDAILTTFIESLQYITFCVLNNAKEGSALLKKILSEHVLPLLETSFYESKHIHLVSSKLYSLLGSLIQKTEYKCLNDSANNEEFSKALATFWSDVYNIFCKFFEKKDAEKVKISLNITYFFHSIFMPLPSIKNEKNKVRFDDERSDTQPLETSKFSCIDKYKKMPISFKNATKFIKLLCAKIDEDTNLYYLKILDEILASTLNAEFLKDILMSCDESCNISEINGLTFFNKIILKWVTQGELNQSCFIYIGDIVFSLCSSVSEGEAFNILNTCCEVKNPLFLENILNKALNYTDEAVIQNWLKNPTLVEYIIQGWKEMMESILRDETIKNDSDNVSYKNILLLSFINKNLQATLIEKGNIEKILVYCKEFIEEGLSHENIDYILEMSCSVIATLLGNCKDCWTYNITDKLLSVLFYWKLNYEEYKFSDKASSLISDVWHSALVSACKNKVITRKDSFLMTAAKELHSELCTLLNVKKATRISKEIVDLLFTVEEVQLKFSDISDTTLNLLLEDILPSDADWLKLTENLVVSPVPSTLERKCMYPHQKENVVISQTDLYKLYLATTTVSSVFVTIIDKYSSSKNKQYLEKSIEKHFPNLLWCVSYFSGNGYINKDAMKELDICLLDNHIQIILKYISDEKLKDVLYHMFYWSNFKGLSWALPFQLLIEKTENLCPESRHILEDLMSETEMMESNNVSLIKQILSHHISKPKKIYYLEKSLQSLLSKLNSSKKVHEDYLEEFAEICCLIKDSDVINENVQKSLSEFLVMFPSFDECPKDSSLFCLECIYFISSIAQHMPHEFPRSIWNFLQSFIFSFLKHGKTKSFDKLEDLCSIFQVSLAYSTSYYFIRANEDREMSWTPSVSDEINEGFISLFIHISSVIKKFDPLPRAFDLAFSSLLKSIECIPENVVFNYVMHSPASVNEFASKSEKASTSLDKLLSILLSDIPHLQLSAHSLLMKVMPLLSESLSKCECYDNEEEEEKLPTVLLPLVDTLNVLNELMESILWDIKIGECCVVLPNSEPYAFVSAYLFAWLEMLNFISHSPSQLRSGYVAHLKETKLLSSLFSNVFRLMPENPSILLKKGSECDSPKKDNIASLFLHSPMINADDPSSEKIQIIACHTFCTAMRKLPASVRTWWNNLDKKSADIVNKFTSKYISGNLCAEEIQAVYNNENLFKNMVIKTRLGSREVIATYAVEDFTIELCVQLPANYPLGPITAEKRGKIIISVQECRHWLMQLTTVLNYQNGSILDGLNIWKKNLDKKFEGVEECMICYYILHNTSMKLPKLSCHTCRKKFHSACLYKWFQSINNTKCPLCRNEFTI